MADCPGKKNLVLVWFISALVLLLSMVDARAAVFIETGATWKYLDDGSDQGTAWRTSGFIDSGWAEG